MEFHGRCDCCASQMYTCVTVAVIFLTCLLFLLYANFSQVSFGPFSFPLLSDIFQSGFWRNSGDIKGHSVHSIKTLHSIFNRQEKSDLLQACKAYINMGLGLLHVIVTTYILHIHYIYTLPNIALVTTSPPKF